MEAIDKELINVSNRFIDLLKKNLLIVFVLFTFSIITSYLIYKFTAKKYVAKVVLDSTYLAIDSEVSYKLLLGLESQIESNPDLKIKGYEGKIKAISSEIINEDLIQIILTIDENKNLLALDTFLIAFLNQNPYVEKIITEYNRKLALEKKEIVRSLNQMDELMKNSLNTVNPIVYEEGVSSYFEARNAFYSRISELDYRIKFISGYSIVKSSSVGLENGNTDIKSYLLIGSLLGLLLAFFVLIVKR